MPKERAPSLDDCISFYDWLMNNHQGREKSIKANAMPEWGKSPLIRKMVHFLRVNGVPICSCTGGYYYSDKPEDIEASIRFLESYNTSIRDAINGLRGAI